MTLEVRDLHFAYVPDEPVLKGVDLEVPRGESGFLLGPSGCGKSTILRCIAGLEQDYRGEIRYDTGRLDGLPPHERSVGMLFQEPALFPHLKVWQNVAFGLKYRHVPRSERRDEAQRYLALVELANKADVQVNELSGGQRQRVDLARTLAAKPRIVLLDEPLGALDTELRHSLGPRIKDLLAAEGVVALWVTHDQAEAERLGDRVWQMKEGRLGVLKTR
jgi:ABC-type Fe3+/spermidine/putrescine transport system ATPase subunit